MSYFGLFVHFDVYCQLYHSKIQIEEKVFESFVIILSSQLCTKVLKKSEPNIKNLFRQKSLGNLLQETNVCARLLFSPSLDSRCLKYKTQLFMFLKMRYTLKPTFTAHPICGMKISIVYSNALKLFKHFKVQSVEFVVLVVCSM